MKFLPSYGSPEGVPDMHFDFCLTIHIDKIRIKRKLDPTASKLCRHGDKIADLSDWHIEVDI